VTSTTSVSMQTSSELEGGRRRDVSRVRLSLGRSPRARALLAGAAGVALGVGIRAYGYEGVVALLALTAILVGAAQQTLP
jgi:anti-sigma factor RsiW